MSYFTVIRALLAALLRHIGVKVLFMLVLLVLAVLVAILPNTLLSNLVFELLNYMDVSRPLPDYLQ